MCVTETAEVDSSHDTSSHDTSIHDTSGLIPMLMKHHGTSTKLIKLNLGCPTQVFLLVNWLASHYLLFFGVFSTWTSW